ncbi:MAG: hypothetical protein RH916_05040 [Vicingaceae bacterium]
MKSFKIVKSVLLSFSTNRLQTGLFLGIIFTLGTINFGCAKEDCECPTQSPQPIPPDTISDEYYVKYEMQTAFAWGNRTIKVDFKMPDGTVNTFFVGQGSTGSETIGPVEKGFIASMTGTAEYDAVYTGRIYTSKNNGVFALKSTAESSGSIKTWTMRYTVE